MVPRLEPAGVFALALLSIIWAWWAAKEGAYFGVVMLPGTIVLCIGAALLAGFAPWRGEIRRNRPAGLALAALGALGAWSLLSAFWSPAPDIAILDGQRILVYALAFGLGIWLCNLLGPRLELSLLPLAGAAAFAGLLTLIALVSSDTPRDLLEIDGTLDFPLGYRNANSAFFAIAMFPALGLAAHRELDWRLRGAAVATATLCVDFILLGQSRGTLPALLVALIVYALFSPLRVRTLSWLALAAVPAIGVVPALTDLYTAANAGTVRDAVSEMHGAGFAAMATTALSLVLGSLAARNERRLPGLGSTGAQANRSVARGIGAVAVVAVVGFVVAVGDPADWIGKRATEFKSAGTPNLTDQSSRFTFNAGSDRYDLWRVALDDFSEDPLQGDGGGGYQYTYTAKREAVNQNAHDAHSVELEVLAELGLPGLALLLCAIGGAALGVIRARRHGPTAATVGAIALASGTYWLAHSSIDWFWPYPGVTAPTMALIGAACGPAVLSLTPRKWLWWRPWLVVGTIVLALSTVPFWLSDRFVDSASKAWRVDAARAFDDLDSAQALNPWSNWPLLVEGEIARQLGDTDAAIDAFGRAVDQRPEEYAGYYRLAELHQESDPVRAKAEITVALGLNPLDEDVRGLARRLGVEPPPSGE